MIETSTILRRIPRPRDRKRRACALGLEMFSEYRELGEHITMITSPTNTIKTSLHDGPFISVCLFLCPAASSKVQHAP